MQTTKIFDQNKKIFKKIIITNNKAVTLFILNYFAQTASRGSEGFGVLSLILFETK